MYERFLAPMAEKQITLMEVGIQYGGSMLLWQDYLPAAKCIFLDNIDSVHGNIYQKLNNKRCKLLFQDAYTADSVKEVKKLAPLGLDIAIDDGPHTLDSQCLFLALYLPLLTEGGVAIVEDVQDVSWFDALEQQVPEGYVYERIDLRSVKGRYDDLVFAVTKQ
jgi:cephalosporin hydroxylase